MRTTRLIASQFVSANGYAANGYSWARSIGLGTKRCRAVNGSHKRSVHEEVPTLVDNDLYVTEAWWYCLPGVTRNDIKLDTFRSPNPPANHIVDKANNGGNAMAKLRAVALLGLRAARRTARRRAHRRDA